MSQPTDMNWQLTVSVEVDAHVVMAALTKFCLREFRSAWTKTLGGVRLNVVDQQQKWICRTSFTWQNLRMPGRRHFAAARGPGGKGLHIIGSVGEYDILKILGKGAFGKVYMAKNSATGDLVAVKALPYSDLIQQSEMSRVSVTREIFAMMSIKHPYVAQLYDIALHSEGKLCLVMELCAGGDLYGKLRRTPDRMLPEEMARRYFQQLIDAVVFCHSRGVFHRDLKTQNVLLDSNDTLKVADFGLSAIVNWEEEDDPRQYGRVGTVTHMAPEVISSDCGTVGYMGGPADLWSCGVVLYDMLTGCTPFNLPDKEAGEKWRYERITHGIVPYLPHLSFQVREFIARFLQPKVADRITPAEIYSDDWFRKDYQPPDFKQIAHVSANLKAIQDIFSKGTDETRPGKRTKVVLPNPPLDWLHKDVPIDFYDIRPDRRVAFQEETAKEAKGLRYTSTREPESLMQMIETAVKIYGCETRVRDYRMEIVAPHEVEWQEPLHILAEVLPSENASNVNIILFRRVSGDPQDFNRFLRFLSRASASFMVEERRPKSKWEDLFDENF